jgi:hypothetical protein
VSGFAIHHVDDARKRSLLGELRDALAPGGLFANLEVVRSSTPRRHREFLDAIGRTADDPEDRLAPVEPQLEWMRAAGFTRSSASGGGGASRSWSARRRRRSDRPAPSGASEPGSVGARR